MKNNTYHILLNHLANTDDPNKIKDILKALLSDKEQQDIANRIKILELLDKGLTQREVSQRLGVGIATVSRGAKILPQKGVNDLLQTLREDKKS